MSNIKGRRSVGTKLDDDAFRWMDRKANENGVTKAELLRRLLEHYHESENGRLKCPRCGKKLTVKL